MSIKIRLARGGSKKRPFYRIVVADVRAPRDGRFIEKIGTYDPMLGSDHPERIRLDEGRAKHWLGMGAEPTDRVGRFLMARNIIPRVERPSDPIQSQPKKRAQERLKAQEAALAASAEN
jgi:small subunit ribosomal protein S16